MNTKIKIFDTTLRDGEQSPGFSMNTFEKIQVAKQLDRLNVDVIEAGFPVSSPDDFEAVKQVAKSVQKAEVCALSRAMEKDINIAFESVKEAKKPKIHTFIATSPIHREYKLKKTKDEILEMATKAVKLAKSLVPGVVFSPEDGSRTEKEYLHEVIRAVLEAGADVINLADTVGYAAPEEFGEMCRSLVEDVINPFNKANNREAILSTHCQNDLGMATACSLSGILGGAREIQCTINGIGERAGNASLEEVVMAIETRKDFYGFETNINTKEIYPARKLITTITGVPVQPNKAIVGANAFAHESGIHQDGVLKHRETYEIMKAEDIGLDKNKLVLGKHSGKHAVKVRLTELGYDLEDLELTNFMVRFKELADKKKEIFDQDLHLLMSGIDASSVKSIIEIIDIEINCGTKFQPAAAIELKINDESFISKYKNEWDLDRVMSLNEKTEGNAFLVEGEGDGPVDAAFQALHAIFPIDCKLQEFSVNAVTSGIDAQATVNIQVQYKDKIYNTSASDTDIVTASIQAYLSTLNQIVVSI